MDFFNAHWLEILGAIVLLMAGINIGRLSNARDKAEMAVAVFAERESWTEYQRITVGRQISTDTTLEQIGHILAVIMCLLMILGGKLLF